MQSPTMMRACAGSERLSGSRGPDSEGLSLSAAPAGSACTAVGAELGELGRSIFSVCEPPGFIAAESSRASRFVETN
jgi:hypothetical protein